MISEGIDVGDEPGARLNTLYRSVVHSHCIPCDMMFSLDLAFSHVGGIAMLTIHTLLERVEMKRA